MLKKHELATPTSCLNKAAPDEMVFVLRGKDPHAPQAIRLWADMSEGEQEPGKLAEARAAADAMDKWRIANQPPEPAPPPPTARAWQPPGGP
jgi:hypothetical protein